MNGIDPKEVNAIAGNIIGFVEAGVAATPETIVAALKSAAATFDEVRQASITAEMRAAMLRKFRGSV